MAGETADWLRGCLVDLDLFSRRLLRRPLRGYQLEPLLALLDSLRRRRGDEFLLVFPRQSGKNEAVAQFLAYWLNLCYRRGGQVVYAATGDGLGRGVKRLEEHLANELDRRLWRKSQRPIRRSLGRASVVFVSAHPAAAARGETAHWLLVVDELQEHLASHIEAVFTPMRAAHNASALYLGTVRSASDALWQKKLELERLEAADGRRRVFMVGPEQVGRESRAYADFVARQVALYGRHHPIVASEYFLEPMDAAAALFDRRRLALLAGDHERQAGPRPGRLYLATLDVAGADEAATGPLAQLARPGRDYTVATVVEVDELGGPTPGLPLYRAVDVFVDQGSRHFADEPGRPALAHRLVAWLAHWRVAHLVADETGVGHGLVGWLAAALGPGRVSGFSFAGPGAKAALGSGFIALVETGRFKYWAGDREQPGSDGWWFFAQAAACRYELAPGGRFDRDLRWGTPDGARLDLPGGAQPVHDDRLLSAALVAELERLRQKGALRLGLGDSAIIPPAGDDGVTG
jgi:hypothetical protein